MSALDEGRARKPPTTRGAVKARLYHASQGPSKTSWGNKAALEAALAGAGINYLFLGRQLGARPDDPACFVNGRVSYDRLGARPEFAEGLDRVRETMAQERLALMCAERDPIECHRMILVCRGLRAPDVDIRHILFDGSTETNQAAEARLCAALHLAADLWSSEAEAIEQAYDRQSRHIAYAQTPARRRSTTGA